MTIISIGLDAEFMSYISGLAKKDNPVYPKTVEGRDLGLMHFGCDEFGHCLEARPKEATTAGGLVTNTMKAMEALPEGLSYVSENAHLMGKKMFIALVKLQGGKELPTCKNIYGGEILDDCKADLDARKAGKRLLFCGMHIHVSAKKVVKESFKIDGKTTNKDVEIPIKLPFKSLVYLFDKYLFEPLKHDKDFNIGRYRSPGFYELKRGDGSHFEYRSLGSSAFTPERLYIIFEIIEELINNFDHHVISNLQLSLGVGSKETKKLNRLVMALANTVQFTGDLRKLWVPWR